MVELASDFLDRNTPVFRDDVCFFLSQSGMLSLCHPLLVRGSRSSFPGFLEYPCRCCCFPVARALSPGQQGPGLRAHQEMRHSPKSWMWQTSKDDPGACTWSPDNTTPMPIVSLGSPTHKSLFLALDFPQHYLLGVGRCPEPCTCCCRENCTELMGGCSLVSPGMQDGSRGVSLQHRSKLVTGWHTHRSFCF